MRSFNQTPKQRCRSFLLPFLMIVLGFYAESFGGSASSSIKGVLEIGEKVPAGGMEVTVYKYSALESQQQSPIAKSISDSAGVFSVPNIPAGDYTVVVKPPAFQENPAEQPMSERKTLGEQKITITPSDSIKQVNFSFSRVSLFTVKLLAKDSAIINGTVMLDNRPHGKTGEKLIATSGYHKVVAESVQCKPKERVMFFLPWDEDPRSLQEIQLHCP